MARKPLSVRCPLCHARVYEKCFDLRAQTLVDEGPRYRVVPHVERVTKAREG
jgi:hypothetical protein